MSDLSTPNMIEDMSVVLCKRMTKDEQGSSARWLSPARARKALEIVMQIGAVLDLRQLTLAATLGDENREQVLL